MARPESEIMAAVKVKAKRKAPAKKAKAKKAPAKRKPAKPTTEVEFRGTD